MSGETVINELVAGWTDLIDSVEARKSEAEKPDEYDWSVVLDLGTAVVTRDALAAMQEAGQFLCARLAEFEPDDRDAAAMVRDYLGHVAPAMERLKAVLARRFDDEAAA